MAKKFNSAGRLATRPSACAWYSRVKVAPSGQDTVVSCGVQKCEAGKLRAFRKSRCFDRLDSNIHNQSTILCGDCVSHRGLRSLFSATEGLAKTGAGGEGKEEGGEAAATEEGAGDELPWAYTSDDSISFPVDCVLQGDLLVRDFVRC